MPVDGDVVLKAGLDTTDISKKMDSMQKTISRGLKNIIRVGFGVRSVFMLIRKLRTALFAGFGDLAQVYEPFNSAMSQIMTSLRLLRNTFASAFAPIIETVAPALSTFINMIAEAVSKIGQFIAALTGKEYVQAGTAYIDYAKSLDKSSKSSSNATKQTKQQTEAQKKLNREITHFDDLVILHEKHENENTTPTTTTTPPTSTFTPVGIGDAITQFAKDFKSAWAKADFTDLGRQVGEKLKNMLEHLPWEKIQAGTRKVAKSIATFLNGFLETPGLFTKIGNTVGEAINTVLAGLSTFAWNFHWDSLGTAVSDAMKAALSTINWDDAYSAAEGFGRGYAQYLNNLITPETFGLVGTTLANVLNSAFKFLAEFGTTFDWTNFGVSLATGINNFLENLNIDDFKRGVHAFVYGIRDSIVSFLDTVNWYKFGTTLRDIIEAIPWTTILTSFGKIIWYAIKAVINAAKGLFIGDDTVGKPVVKAFERLQKAIDSIVDDLDFDTIASGFSKIVNALKPAAEGFAAGFINVFATLFEIGENFLEALGPALSDIGTAIQGFDSTVIESIGVALGTFVGSFVVWRGLSAVGGIISGAASAIGGLLTTLAAHPLITMGIGLASILTGINNLSKSGFFSDADSKAAIENCRKVIDETEEVRKKVSETLDTIEGKDRDIEATYETIRTMATEYFNLKSKVNLTHTEVEKLQELEQTLSVELPGFQEIIGNTTTSYSDQKDAVFELVGQTETYYKTLAAKEYLQEYYSQMFELEVAIQKNRTAHEELIGAYDNTIDRSSLLGGVVGEVWDLFDGTQQAIRDNDKEYQNLLTSQEDLTAGYEAQKTVLEKYGMATQDANTDTSNFASTFDAFDSLSIATPIKMLLLSTAIKNLGEAGVLSDGQVSNLQTTLDEYNANPTEQALGNIKTAFENTGIKADDFNASLAKAMAEVPRETRNKISDAVREISSASDNFYKESKEDAKQAGKGLEKGAEEAEDGVKTAFNNVAILGLGGLDTGFDSHSPSKETYKRGMWAGQGLQNGLNSMKSALIQTAQTISTSITSKFSGYKTTLNSIGSSWMSNLESGLNSYSTSLQYTAQTIGGNIYSAFNDQGWYTLGDNIGIGIYNGLVANSGWLSTLAWNTAVEMYNSACAALGIASPSKKFAWVGEMVTKGLGKGIVDNQEEAVDAVTNMTTAMTDEAEKTHLAVEFGSSVDNWIENLDTVLTEFSDTIINRFDGLINTLAQLSSLSASIPAVAQGRVIPSSVVATSSVDANSSEMRELLNSLASQQVGYDELRALLIEMFTDYMRTDFYLGDEQIARHANNGNLLLNRRYSIMKS